jgi:predicted DNA-binding transcriptional regulator YafY
MQRTERLTKMIARINSGRRPTVQCFMEDFECSERTVLEDIRYLKEQMNMAIEYDRFGGGYINRDPKQVLPPIELTEGELFALTLGKDMLTEYSGTAFEPILESAIQKIVDRLPDRSKVDVAELSGVVRFKPSGLVTLASRKTWFDLNKACEDSKIVQITYYAASTGQMSIREIEPYRIVESRGAWYVIAWCRLKSAIRQFAVHRINEYKVSAENFSPREDVDVDRYLDETFVLEHGDPVQRYVIKFDPLATRYVRERKWHASQEFTVHQDGSSTLSVNAARLDEVKRWVLVFGAGAEVIEPAELREVLRAEFEEALRLYSRDAAPVPVLKPARVAAQSPAKKKKYRSAEKGTTGDDSVTAE